MTEVDTHDVVVVGAGPVGLLLATELALGGVRPVVLEQREEPSQESRASTVHARTMEFLDSRGLRAALGARSVEYRGHFGGIPLELHADSAFAGQWKVPQPEIEAVLRERASELGVEVRTGERVADLRADSAGVDVQVRGAGGRATLRTRFLVGCDGETSRVREAAAFTRHGRPGTRGLLRADVTGIDVAPRRFQRLPGGLAVAARRGEVTRVMVHEHGCPPWPRGSAPPFEELVSTWKRVTGDDISEAVPIWIDAFDDTVMQVDAYRAGRVLLAGDAAHQRMPIGGQALNLGLQDAANLGWKLAAHLRGDLPEDVLDSYHRERAPVGARVLVNVAAQADMLLGGAALDPTTTFLEHLVDDAGVRDAMTGMLSGLDVRYPVEGGEHPLLGRRLPLRELRAHGRHTGSTAADLAAGGTGLLLSLPGAAATAGPTPSRQHDRVLAAVVSRCAAPLPWGDAHTVLVRPDGYVAAVADGTDEASLAGALHTWFGSPREER